MNASLITRPHSIKGINKGGSTPGLPYARGTFIGERTIAAHVIRDNYRTCRDQALTALVGGVHEKILTSASPNFNENLLNSSNNNHNIKQIVNLKDSGKLGQLRRLWLEVIWQTSSESCRAYDLKPGTIVERRQSHIEQFEVLKYVFMLCYGLSR